MSAILQYYCQWNEKFDRIKEPYRFLIFISVFIVALFVAPNYLVSCLVIGGITIFRLVYILKLKKEKSLEDDEE